MSVLAGWRLSGGVGRWAERLWQGSQPPPIYRCPGESECKAPAPRSLRTAPAPGAADSLPGCSGRAGASPVPPPRGAGGSREGGLGDCDSPPRCFCWGGGEQRTASSHRTDECGSAPQGLGDGGLHHTSQPLAKINLPSPHVFWGEDHTSILRCRLRRFIDRWQTLAAPSPRSWPSVAVGGCGPWPRPCPMALTPSPQAGAATGWTGRSGECRALPAPGTVAPTSPRRRAWHLGALSPSRLPCPGPLFLR